MTANNEDFLQLEALMMGRTYLYTLFHKLFGGEPTDQLLEVLCSRMTKDVVEEYGEDNPTMAGLNAFLDSLASLDQEALLSAAKDEYTRIFVGPAVLPASPYEGPYITRDPSTFQENSIVVREIYRAAGFQPRKLQRVPDDHVALMAHFASICAARACARIDEAEPDAMANDLREQRTFVANHLANWLGQYAVALRSTKNPVLYPQMLEAFAAFAQADVTFLDEAAYYLEQLDADETASADGANQLSSLAESIEELQALQLPFLDENELVEA